MGRQYDEPSTPRVGGYLNAYLLADLIFTALVLTYGALTAGTDTEDAAVDLSLAEAYVLSVVAIAVYAVPIGAVLMPAVHFTCRNVDRQWVHVAAAGLAGAVGVVAAVTFYFDFDTGEDPLFAIVVLGSVSTALARALLIPSVLKRRRAPGRPPFLHRDRGLV